jgi:hypothetical protein
VPPCEVDPDVPPFVAGSSSELQATTLARQANRGGRIKPEKRASMDAS